MGKILIVSNRLPVTIAMEGKTFTVNPSVGGLATGVQTVCENNNSVWIGWPGFDAQSVTPEMLGMIEGELSKLDCCPVYIEQEDIDAYYYGFSNRTIWPIFHYFMQHTEFENSYWESYVRVNKIFAEGVLKNLEEGDTVWIHDYQLLLLPQMIREAVPNVSIGYFLHIPFPSYEVFRVLPWRNELIEGMLGADLIGFHTYDYERHFFSCVKRLLGCETFFNQLLYKGRTVKVDTFPMGIDYEKFSNLAFKQQNRSIKDKSQLSRDIEQYFLSEEDRKLIISIDRLDYTKGIPNRLLAFENFLERYEEYHGIVSLIMLATPTREQVPQYQQMKSEVDELVGRINGRFSTVNWTPIWYFYRSLPIESLVELYSYSDIALITPVRDGMNLVAKEYIASKNDDKGVLILSEMAGAAKEMSEALIINPYNLTELADSIVEALEMPEQEQIERNRVMKKRLARYNVDKWSKDFMGSLDQMATLRKDSFVKEIKDQILNDVLQAYQGAQKRMIFLDYDGTLVKFHKSPDRACPDEELYNLLDALEADSLNDLVLISGRDKDIFDQWFGDRAYDLITEHGVWIKRDGKDWAKIGEVDNQWKAIVRPFIDFFVDRTPGSFIEEKNYSLVWHYRKSDPELGAMRALELKDELIDLVANHNLEIMEGSKVIEIKSSGTNKGIAAMTYMGQEDYDFILGIGDDWTDEYLFRSLSSDAYTVKVGQKDTQARFMLPAVEDVRAFLKKLTK